MSSKGFLKFLKILIGNFYRKDFPVEIAVAKNIFLLVLTINALSTSYFVRDCFKISLLILSELVNFYSPEIVRKHMVFYDFRGNRS